MQLLVWQQEFEPVYEKAAIEVKKMNSSVLIARVDAPENENLADRLFIDGLPTVKWFVNGEEKAEYMGNPER